MTFNNYFYTPMPYCPMPTPSSTSLDSSNGGLPSQAITNYNYPSHPTATTPVFGATSAREINNGNNTNSTYCPYPPSNSSSYLLQTDFIRERMQF